uniref:Uncharacterized protein n=1 Tax=viral metagenome TaxID=1070528 RepID=A0A6H1ZG15_9ZZZZ
MLLREIIADLRPMFFSAMITLAVFVLCLLFGEWQRQQQILGHIYDRLYNVEDLASGNSIEIEALKYRFDAALWKTRPELARKIGKK